MRALAIAVLVAGCSLFRSTGGERCQPGRTVELGLQEDVARFAGCKEASGITIRTGATVDVSPLTELEAIAGNLEIGPTVGVDSIAFNGLMRVGGTIRVASNGSLRGLFFPRLERAGRIEVDNNAVLTTISVPRLERVDGAVVITDNHDLELISATALSTVGGELVIAGHPKLNLLEMRRVSRLAAIRIEANPKLPADVIDPLREKAASP